MANHKVVSWEDQKERSEIQDSTVSDRDTVCLGHSSRGSSEVGRLCQARHALGRVIDKRKTFLSLLQKEGGRVRETRQLPMGLMQPQRDCSRECLRVPFPSSP